MVENEEIIIPSTDQVANAAKLIIKNDENDNEKEPSEGMVQEMERAMKQAAFLESKAVNHAASVWRSYPISKEEDIDI